MAQQHTHHHSHSHHRSKSQRILRYTILALFILSVLIMIPYAAHKLLPFIRSVVLNHKLNVSSLCYIALRIALMLFPLTLALPSVIYSDFIKKQDLIAKFMNVISFFYFISCVADILSYNVLSGYVDTGSDPIMLKLLWNDISLVGVGFSLVEGILWLITSHTISGHKKTVKYMFLLTFGFGIIAPYLLALFTNTISLPSWNVWFSKNIYFHISQIIMLIALFISAISRWLWSSAFWH